jgi:hypothetical protein
LANISGNKAFNVWNVNMQRVKFAAIFPELVTFAIIQKPHLQTLYFMRLCSVYVTLFYFFWNVYNHWKIIAASYMGVRLGITERTARLIMVEFEKQ